MSDQDDSVRSMASHTFGVLIQLMPLDTSTPAPADLPLDLKQSVEQQRSFLNQLLNPKCIPDFKVPVQINAELRSYQQVLQLELSEDIRTNGDFVIFYFSSVV